MKKWRWRKRRDKTALLQNLFVVINLKAEWICWNYKEKILAKTNLETFISKILFLISPVNLRKKIFCFLRMKLAKNRFQNNKHFNIPSFWKLISFFPHFIFSPFSLSFYQQNMAKKHKCLVLSLHKIASLLCKFLFYITTFSIL